jgi:IS5 family transposase
MHRLSAEAAGPTGRTAAIDGRSLLVGGASKDPDARSGRAVGAMGRGYKLHAMINAAGAVVCFDVSPLNVAEQIVAKRLLTLAPRGIKRVVGDKLYDSVRVHRAARAKGRRLYTPLREDRVGRRQQPERMRVLRVIRTEPGKRLLRWRDSIERSFARMSNLGFGLKGLPAWVRRLHRAAAWITGKIIFYNAYLAVRRFQT